MKIKWFGHACFLITSDSGVRIVTDPFDEKVGYTLPKVEADILTTSHGHSDHGNIGAVGGNYKLFNKPGHYHEKGIDITGIESYHDDVKGAKRGSNIIYCFDLDGMKICHCGDLGHILEEKQIQELGKVDILLVPVGGTFTLDYLGAVAVMNQLKPAITIPMHFKTELLTFNIDGVNRFLTAAGGGERVGRQEIEVSKETLGRFSSIVVLDY